jgi:hypothetical protein
MAENTSGIIQTVVGIFKNLFKTSTPLCPISKEEILLGSKFREGLSAIDIASKIIERKKEIGINIGPLPSGAQNIELQMEVIRVEEIVNALITKAKIEVAFPPGTKVTATGGNAGGPIVVQGATIQITKGEGVVR